MCLPRMLLVVVTHFYCHILCIKWQYLFTLWTKCEREWHREREREKETEREKMIASEWKKKVYPVEWSANIKKKYRYICHNVANLNGWHSFDVHKMVFDGWCCKRNWRSPIQCADVSKVKWNSWRNPSILVGVPFQKAIHTKPSRNMFW